VRAPCTGEAPEPSWSGAATPVTYRWASRPKRRVRLAGCALTAALALTASACSSHDAPSEGALQGKSATAILSTSIKAYHAQRSVSFVTRTVTGSTTTTQVGASSPSASSESVKSGRTPVLDAMLVKGTAYLRAGSQLLQNTLGIPASAATAHSGTWISVSKGEPGYTVVLQSLSPAAAVANFLPEEPNLRVAGATQFSGTDAVAVEGSPAGRLAAGSTATVTMFVSTTAPYLPLGATLIVKSAAGKTIEQAASVYGKWNKKVDPTAPSGATPVSTLTG